MSKFWYTAFVQREHVLKFLIIPPITHAQNVLPPHVLIPVVFRMRSGHYNMASDSESCVQGFNLVYVDILFLTMLGSSATQKYK